MPVLVNFSDFFPDYQASFLFHHPILCHNEAVYFFYYTIRIINYIRESLAHFENRMKPQLYVKRITRSTMYENAPFGVRKISFLAFEFSPSKIQ